jgi:hypothetical protein
LNITGRTSENDNWNIKRENKYRLDDFISAKLNRKKRGYH